MTEMNRVEPQKTAGFVDRGFNHAKRRAKIEEEEAEIARLEAIQRGDIEPDAEEVEPQEKEDIPRKRELRHLVAPPIRSEGSKR